MGDEYVVRTWTQDEMNQRLSVNILDFKRFASGSEAIGTQKTMHKMIDPVLPAMSGIEVMNLEEGKKHVEGWALKKDDYHFDYLDKEEENYRSPFMFFGVSVFETPLASKTKKVGAKLKPMGDLNKDLRHVSIADDFDNDADDESTSNELKNHTTNIVVLANWISKLGNFICYPLDDRGAALSNNKMSTFNNNRIPKSGQFRVFAVHRFFCRGNFAMDHSVMSRNMNKDFLGLSYSGKENLGGKRKRLKTGRFQEEENDEAIKKKPIKTGRKSLGEVNESQQNLGGPRPLTAIVPFGEKPSASNNPYVDLSAFHANVNPIVEESLLGNGEMGNEALRMFGILETGGPSSSRETSGPPASIPPNQDLMDCWGDRQTSKITCLTPVTAKDSGSEFNHQFKTPSAGGSVQSHKSLFSSYGSSSAVQSTTSVGQGSSVTSHNHMTTGLNTNLTNSTSPTTATTGSTQNPAPPGVTGNNTDGAESNNGDDLNTHDDLTDVSSDEPREEEEEEEGSGDNDEEIPDGADFDVKTFLMKLSKKLTTVHKEIRATRKEVHDNRKVTNLTANNLVAFRNIFDKMNPHVEMMDEPFNAHGIKIPFRTRQQLAKFGVFLQDRKYFDEFVDWYQKYLKDFCERKNEGNDIVNTLCGLVFHPILCIQLQCGSSNTAGYRGLSANFTLSSLVKSPSMRLSLANLPEFYRFMKLSCEFGIRKVGLSNATVKKIGKVIGTYFTNRRTELRAVLPLGPECSTATGVIYEQEYEENLIEMWQNPNSTIRQKPKTDNKLQIWAEKTEDDDLINWHVFPDMEQLVSKKKR